MNPFLLKQCVAELIGTFALIFVGVGAINNNPGLLGVAFAHGLTIAVMVSATAGISGGHLNPAVTFGLLVGKQIDARKAVAYGIAQLLGGVMAGVLLVNLVGTAAQSGGAVVAAGTPDLMTGISPVKGTLVEAVLTFFLVFVVYGTAVDPPAPRIGGPGHRLNVALGVLFRRPPTRDAERTPLESRHPVTSDVALLPST